MEGQTFDDHRRAQGLPTMFDDLMESIREAGLIFRGEAPPSREFDAEPRGILATPVWGLPPGWPLDLTKVTTATG